jgi:hypothetical protein
VSCSGESDVLTSIDVIAESDTESQSGFSVAMRGFKKFFVVYLGCFFWLTKKTPIWAYIDSMYLISAVNSIYTLCITLGGRV